MPAGFQPITVTSEYAEIIYFLRNGNLYRRVLLVAPQRQSTIVPTISNGTLFNAATITLTGGTTVSPLYFVPSGLGGNQTSWQGVNDLSARPASTGSPFNSNSVILNTLADLTNRENRFAYQRFSSDFQDINGKLVAGGDGLDDDFNGGQRPRLLSHALPHGSGARERVEPAPLRAQLPGRPSGAGGDGVPLRLPGAYSVPQALGSPPYSTPYGWIHSPEPQATSGGSPVQFDTAALTYLQNINHNPLDTGDNLSIPSTGWGTQTWWGFPTWRETLSYLWEDPTAQVNVVQRQPNGLAGRAANVIPSESSPSQFLPAMTGVYRNTPQPYNDGFGSSTLFFPVTSAPLYTNLWQSYSWEDDLVMTGVRSFDIKAYDNSVAQYVDLGWGDDLRFSGFGSLQYLNQTPTPTTFGAPSQSFDTLSQTFAHEGRMPPLQADLRYDAQFGAVPTGYYGTGFPNYNGNVGDDNPAVVRLRRVWDSWSTEYSRAPATGVGPSTATTPFAPSFPAGPPFTPPIYPSYPPPYPAPLRGIQIQIRVTDPANQRVKTLTIRQDFTDKL